MPLKELAERRTILHRKSDATTVLRHALEDVQIGETAAVSSFGTESVVLLHMVSQISPDTPVLFLDTEMLFPETLDYQVEVAETLGLTDVRIIRPDRGDVMERDVDGLLHQADVDACCNLRKTEPLEAALQDFGSWITGRKRYQGGQRSDLPLFEKAGHRIKVNPLAGWDAQHLSAYIDEHGLPRHPLIAQGYPSVGCWPCTNRSSDVANPRAGRWEGQAKTECGIHFDDAGAAPPARIAS